MKRSVLVTIFFLIMSGACTPSPSITPRPTILPTKDATQIASQVRNAAKSKTATASARLATPYGLPRGACSPFRGQKTLGCVLSFTAVPTEVVSGGSVTFTWAVTGTDTVGLEQHIYYSIASGSGIHSWKNLPAKGSLTIKVDGTAPAVYPFRLWADDPVAGAAAVMYIYDGCAGTYFFDPLSSHGPACPAGPAISTLVTQQAFEHGLMIWIESENLIYALYSSDARMIQSVMAIPEVEGPGPVESNSKVTPPSDRYIPVNRLGKVWQNYDLYQRLGWALEAEQTFTSTIQKNFVGQPIYLRAADGRIIFIADSYLLSHEGTPYWGYLSP